MQHIQQSQSNISIFWSNVYFLLSSGSVGKHLVLWPLNVPWETLGWDLKLIIWGRSWWRLKEQRTWHTDWMRILRLTPKYYDVLYITSCVCVCVCSVTSPWLSRKALWQFNQFQTKCWKRKKMRHKPMSEIESMFLHYSYLRRCHATVKWKLSVTDRAQRFIYQSTSLIFKLCSLSATHKTTINGLKNKGELKEHRQICKCDQYICLYIVDWWLLMVVLNWSVIISVVHLLWTLKMF